MVLFNDESVGILWDTWNIRGLLILSLLVQSFLILFAPFRKQMGGKSVLMSSLWVAYLLADWVATFTIGLIFRAESNDFMALWAPFLLLHLGGPDTITSFSLEDNEFWIRHLLALMIQLGATVLVILRSIRHNMLFLPTLLVFTVGVIKYAERNNALYHASFDNYGDEIPNVSFLEKTAATEPETEVRYLGIMLRRELAPYGTIKNLLVGPLLSPHRRNLSRRAFLKRQSTDQSRKVLNIMEIELSLLYETLYTKLPVVHCKIGYVLRVISLGCTLGALMSFMSITKHYKLQKFDVWLTFSLLISAIALEFISIGLLFFSDFNFLDHYYWEGNREIKFLYWKVEFDNMSNGVKNRRRWSNTICQCNFLTNHPSNCPSWLNKLATELINFEVRNLGDPEWRFIFDELTRKAREAETVEDGKRLCLQKGDGILDKNGNLFWSVKELDYTESLLTWHIATEICFLVDRDTAPDNMDYRAISKLLSDYMFYLLAMQPAMMATVSIDRKEVCKLAYHDLISFFNTQPNLDVQSLAETIFNKEIPKTHVSKVHGYERTSVILGASKLAHQLKDQNSYFQWDLISKVWVELMCYAAINCRPNVHAQQPSRGGQLLTFVWLLMNHLGLGTQFSTEQLSPARGTEHGQDQP